MKKIIRKHDARLSREILSNPFPNDTIHKRLLRSKVVDYRDNSILEDLGNGYMKISPKDKNKLLKL
ncbi:hypothetical protein [Tissierella sp.]|uniref:hypothetical protein n=1 Tax=Tissierella sp. TaxID=41274 RepID=UPI00304A8D67